MRLLLFIMSMAVICTDLKHSVYLVILAAPSLSKALESHRLPNVCIYIVCVTKSQWIWFVVFFPRKFTSVKVRRLKCESALVVNNDIYRDD